MRKGNKISQIVQICTEHFNDIPTITISHLANESYYIVLIGDRKVKDIRLEQVPNCHIFHITEENIIDRIFHRDPMLKKLFANAIVLKDSLRIMPIILNHLPYNDYSNWSPISTGDLEVIFHNSPSPEIFISKTFIPFMEMNKTDLSKCKFIISSRTINNKTDIRVNYFELKENFKVQYFKKQIITNISESSLHMISINNPNREDMTGDIYIRMLQEFSELVILSYSSNNDLDIIVRKILAYYFVILSNHANSINEYRSINLYILEEFLPHSLSAITTEYVSLHDMSIGIEKVKREYKSQFNENRKYFFNEVVPLLNDTVRDKINEPILKEEIVKDHEIIKHLYYALFSASMMHPYYLAFIPFCINEVLNHEI